MRCERAIRTRIMDAQKMYDSFRVGVVQRSERGVKWNQKMPYNVKKMGYTVSERAISLDWA